jgi:hypothetical protein
VNLSEFPTKKAIGHSNINLWVDGNIYHPNPQTGLHPPFHDLKSLICFVGNNNSGLLGYCEGWAVALVEYKKNLSNLSQIV